MTKKRILILNGSFCEQPLIVRAKEMGYHVITTGNMPELRGHKYADEYIPADYSDKDAILKIVQDNNIDRIIGCANDFGAITASYVAERMGWKGYDTYQNTLLLHHKDKFKRYCTDKNIPSVKSEVFTTKEELLGYTKHCIYPIIIKANDLTGGKGIQRANNHAEAEKAADYAFAVSRAKNIIVEPFIVGTQHAVDAFIINGKIAATTSCNCYSMHNPYLIQTEAYPSDFAKEDTEPICRIIQSIVDDLHLADGVFTVQYMRDAKQFYIIEVMRRLCGNLSLTLWERSSGFPWYEGFIRISLGLDCSDLTTDMAKRRFCGHHGIFAQENGIVVDYKIPDDVRPHVFEFIELVHRGEEITDYLHQRIASLLYIYDSKEEMEQNAKSFYKRITVKMNTIAREA